MLSNDFGEFYVTRKGLSQYGSYVPRVCNTQSTLDVEYASYLISRPSLETRYEKDYEKDGNAM